MLLIPQRVIAHRGSSGIAPENTLAAFRLAHQQGIQWVEFDVMLTREGIPVVIHDLDVDRTTNGTGSVQAFTLFELQRLDAGSWKSREYAGERIPTLEEVLNLLQDLDLSANIEIKPALGQEVSTAEQVIKQLKLHWRSSREKILLSSFALESLKTALKLAPEWSRALLLESWSEPWETLAPLYEVVSINGPGVSPEGVVERMNQAGYAVMSYTIDDQSLAKRLWNQGVMAVFSNYPQAVMPAKAGVHPSK